VFKKLRSKGSELLKLMAVESQLSVSDFETEPATHSLHPNHQYSNMVTGISNLSISHQGSFTGEPLKQPKEPNNQMQYLAKQEYNLPEPNYCS
jgi:hypothetical protein